MGKTHIELTGAVEEKVRELSNLLLTSMQGAAVKLILAVADEAIDNVKKFNSQFDATTRKKFLEVYNGTLKELNKKKNNGSCNSLGEQRRK